MCTPNRKLRLLIPLGLCGLCLLVVGASALSNLGLPQHSATVDRLSYLEEARLSEVLHLRTWLGEGVWPGWGGAHIPVMVYNEQYAFLVDYPDPPAGWYKVPMQEARGGPWEEVPGDLFEGRSYYRTAITHPDKTPEGFTVLVGDRWVATFQTREYGEVAFYEGFRSDLPAAFADVVPVRLVWELLMGKTESYVAALEHESFHAFEGMLAPERLRAAESLYGVADGYPYAAMDEPWRREMDVLLKAALTTDERAIRGPVLQFLQLRTERRRSLTPDQAELERLREWEEGLAKYAELAISRRAETKESYHAVDGIRKDPDFKDYGGQEQFWGQQLLEARRTQGRSGDTRFYYSGNAMAVVLDRLMPDWKPQALPGGRYLEDLLQEAVAR